MSPVLSTTAAQRSSPTAVRIAGSVAVVVLVDLQRDQRFWGWSRLVLRRWPLRGVPGLGFAQVLGSGRDGGFGLQPSATGQGLYLLFDTQDSAEAFVCDSPVLAGYRRRARALCVLTLRACSSKGSWAGTAMAVTAEAPATHHLHGQTEPLAALTRASIRSRHTAAFWRHAPPSEAALARAPGCRLAVGLGEAPLLRQATFTLWDSAAAMDAYARSGAHQAAIRAAYGGGWFSESMFVRFRVLRIDGAWPAHGGAAT